MSKNHNEFLSSNERIAAAKMLDWMNRADDERFLRHNQKSAELIAYSLERGMSRATMVRIWGRKLVNAVIGDETTIFLKEEPRGAQSNERKPQRART